jgi:FtsZ-binding cell division protein ZapB
MSPLEEANYVNRHLDDLFVSSQRRVSELEARNKELEQELKTEKQNVINLNRKMSEIKETLNNFSEVLHGLSAWKKILEKYL